MSDSESVIHAQCFCCKSVQEVLEPEVLATKNNRLRLSGKCASCGKNVSKFIQNPEETNKTPRSSPPAQKKIKKKKALKKCANCECASHALVIELQPKRKRTDSLELKRKRLQKLQEQIETEEKEREEVKE